MPPVIPLFNNELNLSATQIGILTGLPSMLFAAACGILLVILTLAINHVRPVGS